MINDVFIVKTAARYPVFPYHLDDQLLGALRSLFSMWGKDPENPFKEWLVPGACVVIKPNWVYHENPSETAQKHRSNYDSRLADDYEIVDLETISFLEDISDYADKFRVTC